MAAALATLATERSISAVRMTKVRPVAMIAVTEMPRSTLVRLPTVRNDGLARPNTTTRKIRVMNGAMLRSWPLIQPLPPGRLPTAIASAFNAIVLCPSRRGEQLVLADGLVRELVRDGPALHHHDPVGEREHRLGLGRDHHHSNALVPHLTHDLHHVVLRPHVHAAGGLGENQHLRQEGQPLGERHLLLVAAGEGAQPAVDVGRADPQALDVALAALALEGGPEPDRGDALQRGDRHVLIERLAAEQHRAGALRYEG